MIINPRPEVLAREFWAGTGLGEVFPRKIEHAIALKLPLALVKLPRLSGHVVGKWLERRRITTALPGDDRDLLGLLVAHRGHGIIFICGADDLEEQRLTVAHEVAHFLMDYVWPRRQMIQALGEYITDVLDGFRAATPAERAAAILSHTHLGAHLHILPRLSADEESDSVVAQAEDRADQLALELVAPRTCIVSFLKSSLLMKPGTQERSARHWLHISASLLTPSAPSYATGTSVAPFRSLQTCATQ